MKRMTDDTMKLLSDHIAVELIEEEKMSAGGLMLPDSAKPILNFDRGVVKYVGPGKWEGESFLKMEVSVGDLVMFRRGGGLGVVVDGEELVVIRQPSVMAIL